GDTDNIVKPNTLLTYTVTFDEDIDASTVTAADFDNAGSSTLTFGTIAETGATTGVFTVQVTPTTAGTLQLRIKSGAVITDVAGNMLAVPVLDNDTLTVDGTAPTVTSIDDSDADNIVKPNTLLTYTITFNEDIDA